MSVLGNIKADGVQGISATNKNAFIVRTKGETEAEFDKAFFGSTAADEANRYIRDVDLRVWSGGVNKDDGRFQETPALTINFAEASTTFDVAVDADKEAYGPLANGKPVYTAKVEDKTKGEVKFSNTIDLQSMAGYIHKSIKAANVENKIYSDKQLAQLDGRVPIKYSYTQSGSGVAAVSDKNVRNIVGKIAVNNFILNPQIADGIDKAKTAKDFTQNPIDKTAKLDAIAAQYTKTFNNVIKEIADGKAEKPLMSNGKSSNGTTAAIPNTDVSNNYKLVPAKLGKTGLTSYAILTADNQVPDDTKEVNAWLRNVGNRISSTFSQDIHNIDGIENDKYTKGIAYSMKTVPYAVRPQDHQSVMLMQPRIIGQQQPFAANLYNAMKAVHADAPFQTKVDENGKAVPFTAEEMADTKKIEADHKLETIFDQSSKFDGKTFVNAVKDAYTAEVASKEVKLSKEVAIQNNKEAFAEIDKAIEKVQEAAKKLENQKV